MVRGNDEDMLEELVIVMVLVMSMPWNIMLR
jgi:hypothetical protein